MFDLQSYFLEREHCIIKSFNLIYDTNDLLYESHSHYHNL